MPFFIDFGHFFVFFDPILWRVANLSFFEHISNIFRLTRKATTTTGSKQQKKADTGAKKKTATEKPDETTAPKKTKRITKKPTTTDPVFGDPIQLQTIPRPPSPTPEQIDEEKWKAVMEAEKVAKEKKIPIEPSYLAAHGEEEENKDEEEVEPIKIDIPTSAELIKEEEDAEETAKMELESNVDPSSQGKVLEIYKKYFNGDTSTLDHTKLINVDEVEKGNFLFILFF